MTATDTRSRGLGRGLDALLGDQAPANGPAQSLPVASLRSGAFQPRTRFDEEAIGALAESIAEHGILQPLLVRPLRGGGYEIVAGERRWRAAQKVMLHEVPVVVRAMEDKQALEIALIENLQRADLDSIEEAQGYRDLIENFGHSQATVSKVMGKSRPHVANMLRLLALPGPVQDMLKEGAITAGHARALLAAPDAATLARHVVKGGLSVRETEEIVARFLREGPKAAPAVTAQRSAEVAEVGALEECLATYTGMAARVKIGKSGKGGSVTLRFSSAEQLDALMKTLAQTGAVAQAAAQA